MKNNFLNTFTLFLKQLKVPVTESSALEYLETHQVIGKLVNRINLVMDLQINKYIFKIKILVK
jgi:hypothetical protein